MATTAWLEAVCRADAKIRLLAKIYNGATTWTCVSGYMESSSDLYSATVALQKVAPVGVELDPLTRDIEMSEMYLDYESQWLRPIILNNRLKGQRVNIYLGAAEIDESDFVNYALNTQIEEIIPREDGHTITLVVRGQLQIVYDHRIGTNYWLNKHPLECLYDGAGGGILELAGGHTFNANSFDETQAVYDSIDHFVIGRAKTYVNILGSNNSYIRQRSDWSELEHADNATGGGLAQQILRLINGHLIENEDGELEVKRFSTSSSTVADWTDKDILPGSFRQESLDSNVVNRFVVKFGTSPNEELKQRLQLDETASQAAYKFPGESERIMAEEFECHWLGAPMWLESNINDSANSLVLQGVTCYGLSGNRSDMTVNADHPIYLMLDSSHTPDINNIEIVKSTSITRDSNANGYPFVWAGGDSSNYVQLGPYCSRVTLSSVARAQLGTAASAHQRGDSSTWIWDITPLVITLQELLKRFAYGCPIIELETNFRQFTVQLGDLVTVTSTQFLAYDMDGTDSGDKWEVVGKEADPMTGRIKWRLAYAYEEPSITWTGEGWSTQPMNFDNMLMGAQKSASQWSVHQGLTVVDAGGLDVTVEAGIATNGSKYVVHANDKDITLPASKDCYLYLQLDNPPFSGVNVKATALAAGDPGTEENEMFLAKVVTGAAAITRIETEGRPATPFPVGKIGPQHQTVESVKRNLNNDFNSWSNGVYAPPDCWGIS